MRYLFVGIAGGLAAVARYSASVAVGVRGFPYATLAVNVTGCFLYGVFVPLVAAGRIPRDIGTAVRSASSGHIPLSRPLAGRASHSSEPTGSASRRPMSLRRSASASLRQAPDGLSQELSPTSDFAGRLAGSDAVMAGWMVRLLSLSPYRELPSRLTAHPDTLSSTFVRVLATEKPCNCLARHHEVTQGSTGTAEAKGGAGPDGEATAYPSFRDTSSAGSTSKTPVQNCYSVLRPEPPLSGPAASSRTQVLSREPSDDR